MKIDPSLPELDLAVLTAVTGGTRFYNSSADAHKMATDLHQWNPKNYYDVVQAKNGKWYVSNPHAKIPHNLQ